MDDFKVYQGALAGIALLLSFLAMMVGFAIVIVQGKLGGLAAAFRGVEGIGEAASGLSILARAGLPSMALQLIGFGVLTAMLQDSGEGSIATAAFGLLIFADIFFTLKGSFEGDMTLWASRRWARTGSSPEIYEALHVWINNLTRPGYIALIVAMAGFGWGVLRAGIMVPWAAWASIGWSLLWLLAYFVNVGFPAIILFYPLIFGIGLLIIG